MKYAIPSTQGLTVRKAISAEDRSKVFDVRWMGYKKYGMSRDEVEDEADTAPHATLLLATNEDQQPIGTMRFLDRNHGDIELDSFLDVDSLLTDDERSCIEFTRLSIPMDFRSVSIVFNALARASYLYSVANNIRTMLISSRPKLAEHYCFMGFEDVGDRGVYYHSALGNTEHRTFKLDIGITVEKVRATKRHPLRDVFLAQNSPNIDFR